MNAKEARQKALAIDHGKVSEQYEAIKAEIELAVYEGKFQAYYYSSILPGVKTALEGEGFQVDSFWDQKEGTTITISW